MSAKEEDGGETEYQIRVSCTGCQLSDLSGGWFPGKPGDPAAREHIRATILDSKFCGCHQGEVKVTLLVETPLEKFGLGDYASRRS